VLVLADRIGSATSNLFFCRRGPTYAEFEQFSKVYSRNGITLNYLNTTDKGRGGEIPAGVINYLERDVFKTKQFYANNLSWDFANTWTMVEGEYPQLIRSNVPAGFQNNKNSFDFKIFTSTQGVDIQCNEQFSVRLFDLTGKLIQQKPAVYGRVSLPAPRGVYVLQLSRNGNVYNQKVIVI
jgi:hypothetical protein